MATDFYTLLGVTRTATAAEIKGYRKNALVSYTRTRTDTPRQRTSSRSKSRLKFSPIRIRARYDQFGEAGVAVMAVAIHLVLVAESVTSSTHFLAEDPPLVGEHNAALPDPREVRI